MGFSVRRTSGRAPLADINITPFVDVMLVLLVVFMVTAPLLRNNLPVNLPKARAPRVDIEESKLLLTITKDKKVYLGEVEIPQGKLEEALTTNHRLQTEKELYIQADADLPYGYVTEIMALVRVAGIEKLGLVTKSDSENKRAP